MPNQLSFEDSRIVERIDAAIARLQANTDPLVANTVQESIARLQYKRGLVLSGNYVIRQVNEECLAAVGHMIAEWAQQYLYRRARQ